MKNKDMFNKFRTTFFQSASFIIALLVFATITIFAQADESTSGQVVNSLDEPVLNASVILRNKQTGLERIAKTNEEGRFIFKGLQNVDYEMTVVASGFSRSTVSVENISKFITIKMEPESLREEVTVFSASRQEELRENLATKVEVVTRSDIRSSGYETVGEVLREIPGIITRRGSETVRRGAGEQVQGIDSRQVLVLIDGQPIVGGRGIKEEGILNLDRQSIGKLDSIEVVKGSSSALFGSDAIGGVINMITRNPDRPFDASVSIVGGNFGVFDGRGILSFKRDKFSGLFNFERHKNNGFDLTPTTADTTGAGFNRYDGYGKFKYAFSDEFSLVGFVNSYWNNSLGVVRTRQGDQSITVDDQSQNYGLTADWSLDARTNLQVRGYFARFDEIRKSDLLNRTRSINIADGNLFERYGKFDATLTRILGERQVVQVGGEWSTNRYRGFNRLRNDSGEKADTRNLWLQDKISFTNRLTLTVGGRYDNHSIFGSAISPKAGLNFRLNENASLRASWGRGYRAPDIGNLYFRFINSVSFYQVIGNPDLSPEHSGSWQVGGEFNTTERHVRFSVNFFRNDVRNLIEPVNLGFIRSRAQLARISAVEGIDSDFRPALFRLLFFYKNRANIFTQGVEFDGKIILPEGFAISGAYTYLDAKDKDTNLYLEGRHRHHGFLKFAYSNPEYGFDANFRGTFYSSWIPTQRGGLRGVGTAPSFQIWDIYAAKKITRGFSTFATIDNLFDDKDPNSGLFSPSGRPLPVYRPEVGRTFRVGLRWNFSSSQ